MPVTPIQRCPLCSSERIPGLRVCANCGEVVGATAPVAFALHTDPLPDHYTPASVDLATCLRAVNEARALEYAGDVEGAVSIYERLTQTRTVNPVPYQRLAIVYRKGKRWPDEERVVRLALAHIPSGPNSWFVLRLAKILGQKPRPTG